jgi:hypothetical protein
VIEVIIAIVLHGFGWCWALPRQVRVLLEGPQVGQFGDGAIHVFTIATGTGHPAARSAANEALFCRVFASNARGVL